MHKRIIIIMPGRALLVTTTDHKLLKCGASVTTTLGLIFSWLHMLHSVVNPRCACAQRGL